MLRASRHLNGECRRHKRDTNPEQHPESKIGRAGRTLRWTDQAAQHDDVKSSDLAPIKRAITDALKEREANLAPSKA